MALLVTKSPPNAADRPGTADHAARRRLLLSDAISLAVLLLITGALALVTNTFYQSYASHEADLARRWLARGTSAMRRGQPEAAIDALRTALAYSPGEKDIEIDLAEALASAGHTQEAVSYFDTLLESEPGSGIVNLELARLAERQGNLAQALDYFRRAIDGTWEVNGALQRRDVRIELVRLLLSRGLDDQARGQLLAAAGNTPEGDIQEELTIASLLEQAQDPTSALQLYKSVLAHAPYSLAGLEGAARTAYGLGHVLEARRYLERAFKTSAARAQDAQNLAQYRDLLRDSSRLLELFPSFETGPKIRSQRILADLEIARQRFDECAARKSAAPNSAPPGGQPSPATPAKPAGPLANLASRFTRHPSVTAQTPPSPAAPPAGLLGPLADRWAEQPATLTMAGLENDLDLAQAEIQLIYDTELVTRQVCGPPSGDDALLLKIAQAPEAVDEK